MDLEWLFFSAITWRNAEKDETGARGGEITDSRSARNGGEIKVVAGIRTASREAGCSPLSRQP